jgi:hypothetical protein
MRSSLVVAALFGISRAMPAKLAARNPNPVWVTTTVYIDEWNTVADYGTGPTGGANQNNGKFSLPWHLCFTRRSHLQPTPVVTRQLPRPSKLPLPLPLQLHPLPLQLHPLTHRLRRQRLPPPLLLLRRPQPPRPPAP